MKQPANPYLLRSQTSFRRTLGFIIPFIENGGESGIRTRGTLVGYDDLANRCFRPLSHLSWCVSKRANNVYGWFRSDKCEFRGDSRRLGACLDPGDGQPVVMALK